MKEGKVLVMCTTFRGNLLCWHCSFMSLEDHSLMLVLDLMDEKKLEVI